MSFLLNVLIVLVLKAVTIITVDKTMQDSRPTWTPEGSPTLIHSKTQVAFNQRTQNQEAEENHVSYLLFINVRKWLLNRSQHPRENLEVILAVKDHCWINSDRLQSVIYIYCICVCRRS